jgi:hypothetical protein
MDPQKKERRQELLHYQREGMRLARDMCKATDELMALTCGDEDAGIEVLTGYAVVMINSLNVKATPDLIRKVCGQTFLSHPNQLEILERLTARVMEVLHAAR